MKNSLQALVFAILMAVMLAVPPANGAGEESVLLQQAKGGWEKPWWFKDPIEGPWDVNVVLTDCASGNPIGIPAFAAMAIFGADGSFHDTNSNSSMFQPRSAAFGYWEHIRGNKYRFAFKAFHFDLAGNYIGYNIIRHDVVLARNGRSYTSRGTAEFYSPDGTTRPPVQGCSESTATRFK